MDSELHNALMKHLIEAYTHEGISLHNVLTHPLFEKLDFDKKVAVIREYGEQIKAGTKLTMGDIGKLIAHTLLGGVGLALAGRVFFNGVSNLRNQYQSHADEYNSRPAALQTPEALAAKTSEATSEAYDNAESTMLKTMQGSLGSVMVGTSLAGFSRLNDSRKAVSAIKNTDMHNMSETDAIKFLAKMSK